MFHFYPDVILRVIIAPNSAFAQIRDNKEKYFAQSIELLIISSFLGILMMLPFMMISFDEIFVNSIGGFPQPENKIGIIMLVFSSMISGIVSAVLFYFLGKMLGRNSSWKKVFSVVFHTFVPAIPMMIVLSILIFLVMNSVASLDKNMLMSDEFQEELELDVFIPLIGYGLLIVGTAIAFVTWIFVVSIKAIKILNEFGTAKAFGFIILVGIVSSIVTIPFGM